MACHRWAKQGKHALQSKPGKPKFHAWGLQIRNPGCTLASSQVTAGLHDNTAPKQLMTAAEMLQAMSEIRSDAQARLKEIRDEIALLEAEMADLEELLDG